MMRSKLKEGPYKSPYNRVFLRVLRIESELVNR